MSVVTLKLKYDDRPDEPKDMEVDLSQTVSAWKAASGLAGLRVQKGKYISPESQTFEQAGVTAGDQLVLKSNNWTNPEQQAESRLRRDPTKTSATKRRSTAPALGARS